MVEGFYGYRLLCQIDEIFHSLITELTAAVVYPEQLSQPLDLGQKQKPVLPSGKSDKEISKSDFQQTISQPKIRPKANTNSLIFWSKSDLFQKPNSNFKQINLWLRKFNICRN